MAPVVSELQRDPLATLELDALCLDSTIIKLHALVADERTALIIALTPGQASDAPAGRDLLRRPDPILGEPALILNRAYHGDQTRQLVCDLGCRPVVPPPNHRNPSWPYDRQLYRRREVERFFCLHSRRARRDRQHPIGLAVSATVWEQASGTLRVRLGHAVSDPWLVEYVLRVGRVVAELAPELFNHGAHHSRFA